MAVAEATELLFWTFCVLHQAGQLTVPFASLLRTMLRYPTSPAVLALAGVGAAGVAFVCCSPGSMTVGDEQLRSKTKSRSLRKAQPQPTSSIPTEPEAEPEPLDLPPVTFVPVQGSQSGGQPDFAGSTLVLVRGALCLTCLLCLVLAIYYFAAP